MLSPRSTTLAVALALLLPACSAAATRAAGPSATGSGPRAAPAARSFPAAELTRTRVRFRLEGLEGRISAARLTRRARAGLRRAPGTAQVAVRPVRRAVAGDGRLTVTVPRSWRGKVRRRDIRLEVRTRAVGAAAGACVVDLAALGTARPPGCWRPYHPESPFNRPVPQRPRLADGSSAMISRMLSFGPLQHLHAGDAGAELDSGRPLYISRPGDPVFTVHCQEAWGRCPIEGAQVRVPAQARVPGASDGHLTVIDPQTGIEWDFWRVQDRDPGGGVLRIGWGGRAQIDGDGLGSDAVAARTATGAGTLRPEELLSGRINHALALSIACDSGSFVFPAAKSSTPCHELGQSDGDGAMPLGSRVWLDMTPHQIDALGLNPIRTTLMKALAEYGAYVVDTGGTWAFVTESGLASTSFGAPDPWLEVSRRAGGEFYAPHARYAIDIRSGVDFGRYLRVLDPCAGQGTC